MRVNSSVPIAPPSPAWGFRPATARRGAGMAKSRIRPAWVRRRVCSSSAGVRVAGTAESGMWMVTGTTRRLSQDSIMTTGRSPARWARYSVWPGKAKPAPSCSAFLWIGPVQMAAAWPRRVRSTARAMTSITPWALRGSGWPGVVGAGKAWGRTGSRRAGVVSASDASFRMRMAVPGGRWPGSPSQKKATVSPNAARAATASSGPRPAGSPQVRTRGIVWVIGR